MSESTSRETRIGKKTGPKPTFNHEDVVRAAVSLGIDTFTIAGVAQLIKVAPPAVYRLFTSRDDLVDACLAAAAKDIQWTLDNPTWESLLRNYAEETWRVCEKYPGLSVVIFSNPRAFVHILKGAGALVDALCDRGMSRHQAQFALDFIGDTAVSTHIAISSMRSSNEHGISGLQTARDRMSDLGTEIPTDIVIEPDASWLDRGNLDEKIDFIIQGLAQGWPEENPPLP